MSGPKERVASFRAKGKADGRKGRPDVARDGIARKAKTVTDDAAYKEGYKEGSEESDSSDDPFGNGGHSEYFSGGNRWGLD